MSLVEKWNAMLNVPLSEEAKDDLGKMLIVFEPLKGTRIDVICDESMQPDDILDCVLSRIS